MSRLASAVFHARTPSNVSGSSPPAPPPPTASAPAPTRASPTPAPPASPAGGGVAARGSELPDTPAVRALFAAGAFLLSDVAAAGSSGASCGRAASAIMRSGSSSGAPAAAVTRPQLRPHRAVASATPYPATLARLATALTLGEGGTLREEREGRSGTQHTPPGGGVPIGRFKTQ